MSFNPIIPLGHSGSMAGRTSNRLTTKDPKTLTAVQYDNDDRVISATYTLVDDTSETITLSYTLEDYLEYQGIEYRKYSYDLFSAMIVPENPLVNDNFQLQEQQRVYETMSYLRDIKDELKKINNYFAFITSQDI